MINLDAFLNGSESLNSSDVLDEGWDGYPLGTKMVDKGATEVQEVKEVPAPTPKDAPAKPTGIVLDGRGQPYCPVFTRTLNDGTHDTVAYLISEVMDVDEYVDLIDVLLTATERDTIKIYIDSPGGYISAGSIISSAIHHSKAQVYTIARGLCASAACLIHNAAKPQHAIVEDMGVLMIHMSLHGDSGVSSLIAKRAEDQVRYVNETLLSQALEMGYLLPEELNQIQNGKQIYISAKDFRARLEAKAKQLEPPAPETPTTTVEDNHIVATEHFGYTEKQLEFIVPNLESFDAKRAQARLTDPAMVDPELVNDKIRQLKANALRIKTTDGKNFRIYMPSDLMFSRSFITNLCFFLDTRKEDETVTFVLGAKLMDATAAYIGAIVSAIRSCKATIITLAAGYCSIPETMIWVYGDERVAMRYGALTFGITEIVEVVPKYRDYYQNYLNRALEIGIINEDDIKSINGNGTVFKMYNEIK